MAAREFNVGGDGTIFVGEDKTLLLEVVNAAGVPVRLDGWTIRFVVRKRDNSPDPAIFDREASIGGLYNIDRALNAQRAVVQLTDTELNTVKGRTYRYSWKKMEAGLETILSYGDFTPQKATAP